MRRRLLTGNHQFPSACFCAKAFSISRIPLAKPQRTPLLGPTYANSAAPFSMKTTMSTNATLATLSLSLATIRAALSTGGRANAALSRMPILVKKVANRQA